MPNIFEVGEVFAVILRFVLSCGCRTTRNLRYCDGPSCQHGIKGYILSNTSVVAKSSSLMRELMTIQYSNL